MPKDKKSKKNGIDKLRMVLDNASFKELNPEDEKHLIALKQRLIEKENKKVIYKSSEKKDEETEVDPLKPKVVIHQRKEEKKLVKFQELKPEQKIKETKEDLIEIKKIEVSGPEFVKVKPKKIEKKEKIQDESPKEKEFIMVESPEEKTEQKEEKIELLPEWKPVEPSEPLTEETPSAEKQVPVKKSEDTAFCRECGSKLEKDHIFCSNCGLRIEIEFEKVEEKPEEVSVEPEAPTETESAPEIIDEGELAKKIEAFKDLECIDKETSILLYDNGYTSIDTLKIATIKDLAKIKGIKRKTAKKIKKELEAKTEWEVIPEGKNDTDSQVISFKETIYCKSCGCALEDDMVFCPECGKSLNEAEKKEEAIITPEPQPKETIEEKLPDKPLAEKEDTNEIKIEAFKELNSIDEKTAVLLYDNGYTSFDLLKNTEYKDLVKINGMKRKTAKKIRKELDEKIQEAVDTEEIPIGETLEVEITEDKIPEEETIPQETKIEAFKDLNSIDEKTAVLLYDNGYTTIDTLKNVEYKDLVKTKGLKRKTAKKIREELDEKIQEAADLKPIPIGETAEKEITEDQVKENTKFEDEKNPVSPVELSSKTSEWAPVEEEAELKEKKEEEPQSWEAFEDLSTKTEPFQDIECIDEETAVLLYDNGFISLDMLKLATIKDLAKIKGIKRKTAKKIKKELEAKTELEKEETVFEEEPAYIEEQKFITHETGEEKEDDSEKRVKIAAFDEIENIDEETAILLYDNGFTSLDLLKTAELKDIKKIKGIKKRHAKKILKELEEKFPVEESILIEEKDEEIFEEDEFFEETDSEILDEKISEHDDEKPKETTPELFLEEEELDEDVPEIKPDNEAARDYVFKEISSIDEKISRLLIENGIDSIEELNDKTIKELTKIKGIKRKIAKKIKKDVEEHINVKNLQKEKKYSIEENPFINEGDFDEGEEWESVNKEKPKKARKKETRGFQHGDFTLYEKEYTTKKGNKRIVRFFSKGEPEDVTPIKLPKGYEVKENKKTGVPYIRKKK